MTTINVCLTNDSLHKFISIFFSFLSLSLSWCLFFEAYGVVRGWNKKKEIAMFLLLRIIMLLLYLNGIFMLSSQVLNILNEQTSHGREHRRKNFLINLYEKCDFNYIHITFVSPTPKNYYN